MPRAIDVALELIANDLVVGGVPVPRIDETTWQDWDPSESVTLYTADGSGQGVWLDLGLPQPERLAHLADQVQEWAVEELARLGRSTNWPVCPDHPANHPLQATVENDLAVWACPAGGTTSTPIGTLSRN